jgi:tetratricopeptide (TPR) repeat protein
MIDEPATQGDEYCAVLLAACDDALVAGEPSSILQRAEVSPELRRRLQRAMASVRLLRQSFQQRQSVASTGAPLPWTALGRFEIRRELGRGAYGIVYLAYDPKLRREVALKVPRPESIVTPELRDRFLREAQAAASLEHPNLVPVYEVGEVGPVCYLASAYCPGQTLAAWLKEQRELTPWRDAALLVSTLADAVQHAHSRGILHRDLKPANILLQRSLATEATESTERRREGGEAIPSNSSVPSVSSVANSFTPRITDFGLAKFLVDGEPEPTRSGTVLGTAAYMAPEQASGHSRQVGRQADVYALGVLLYELLTGRPPFQADSMLETLEQVRTHEPVPPRRLRPRLPRDLETVCLKSLQKQPRDRYQSAGELGEELRRFLRGEPIRARPVSAVNRAVRWCRRKPALAAASGLAVASLFCALGLAIGMAIQQGRAATRLKEEAARAQLGEQRAKQSAEEAQAVLGFFQNKVLAAARPKGQRGGLGRDATIRAAVEATEPLITKAFADQPTVEAAIRHSLGTTYIYLGELKLAIGQLELAWAERRAHLGQDHPDTLQSMNNLAAAYLSAGRLAESISLHEETLKLRRAKLGPDHPDTLESMSNLASAYRDAGRRAESISLHEETLELQKARLGPDHPDTLRSVTSLANAYRDAGRLADAISLQEESLKLQKEKIGQDHPDTLNSMNSLANLYQEAGRSAESISLHEEVLQLRKARLGPDHPDTLDSMNNLANAYQGDGRLADAISLNAETLRLKTAKLGADHPETLRSMVNLAYVYHEAGRRPEALALFEEATKLYKAKLGPDHPDTLGCMKELAKAYRSAGRVNEALVLFEQVLELQKASQGPDHPGTLFTMNDLAIAYHDAGHLSKALSLFEETFKLSKSSLGPDHPETLNSMANLALTYRLAGRLAEAVPLLEETLKARKVKLGPDHPQTLRSMNNLANGYRDCGRLSEAIPLSEETLKLRKSSLGPEHPSTLDTMSNLAFAYQSAGRLTEAISLQAEALRLCKAKLGPDDLDTLVSMNRLAEAYFYAGQAGESLALYEQALKRIKDKFGLDYPLAFSTVHGLARVRMAQREYAAAEVLLADAWAAADKREADNPREAAALRELLGDCLMCQGNYSKAESVLHVAPAARERMDAEGWETAWARSLLGGALVGQRKYADAEPLLVAGYSGMKEREMRIPVPERTKLTEALDRVVQLYDAWGKKDKADLWRKQQHVARQ